MGWNYLSIPKLKRCKLFHSTHYNGCNHSSMLGLKLNHVSKSGPGRSCVYSTWLRHACLPTRQNNCSSPLYISHFHELLRMDNKSKLSDVCYECLVWNIFYLSLCCVVCNIVCYWILLWGDLMHVAVYKFLIHFLVSAYLTHMCSVMHIKATFYAVFSAITVVWKIKFCTFNDRGVFSFITAAYMPHLMRAWLSW